MASLEDESVFSLVVSKFKIFSLNTHQKRAITEVANKGKDIGPLWGGALRDEPKDGCEGDYANC